MSKTDAWQRMADRIKRVFAPLPVKPQEGQRSFWDECLEVVNKEDCGER